MSIMLCSRLCATQLASATCGILLMLSAASLAQRTVPAASLVQALGLQCNGDPKMVDPFKGRLADPDLPVGLLPIDQASRDNILKSGLPCQENVSPVGDEKTRAGKPAARLRFLFMAHFYRAEFACRRNVPSISRRRTRRPDGRHMDNFKQLLDVMLPANLQPPKWPTDETAMEDERERLMPEACRALEARLSRCPTEWS